jgi:AraC-binding-like domain
VAQGFSPVKIDFAADRGPVAANFVLSDWGDRSMCSSVSSAVMLRRTAALAKDDSTPSVFLALQMAGSSVMMQRDRQVVLRPGELMVYDSTAPWTMSDANGIRQYKFRIPLDRMALPYDVITTVSAVTLCPGHPIVDLTAPYFQDLAARQTSFADGHAISGPSIELLRAVITTHFDAGVMDRESHATLLPRIMTYVRAHLRDLDLSAGEIAREHHLSVRSMRGG